MDKKTGAPQFASKDLVACGTRLPSKYGTDVIVVGVTVDDLNLFLRAHALRKKKKRNLR